MATTGSESVFVTFALNFVTFVLTRFGGLDGNGSNS